MLTVLGANGPSGFRIANSLRFRSSASAYLNRTPSVAGNRQTWTWSGWVKRGGAIGSGTLLSLLAGSDGASSSDALYFTSDYIAYFQGGVGAVRGSTAVYRDPSAWYHIVAVSDTTNATAQNRFRIYINGVEITTWTTNVTITQNRSGYINFNTAQYLGSNIGSQYFDGYMAEVNFIDGQALTPSSFGETDAVTGVWKPKRYSGTYGTNGFRLNFSNGTSTTTLGYDTSGNGNDWTPVNISSTPGVNYDLMLDSPTPFAGTSYGVGNYCVMNPLNLYVSSVADGNLSATTSNIQASNRGTISVSSGKWYWEVTNGGGNPGAAMIGVARSDAAGSNCSYNTANGWYYFAANGQKYNNNAGAAYGASYTTSTIGVALDCDNGTLVFYKDGVSQGTAYTGLSGIPLSPNYSNGSGTSGSTGYHNFGQRPFAYTPPTGFKTLCTQNLPAPTIKAGNKHFDATTYAGNGAAQSIVNSGGFQPDLVWVKCRNNAYNNILVDVQRGVSNILISELTNAEQYSAGNWVTALNSNGFTVANNNGTNASGSTYVGWQWKAGGTAVTNTNGSITSSVSANTTAGFSVVTYTGNNSSGATIGHGLGIAPSMVIIKSRSSAYKWIVYHASLAATYGLVLNATDAAAVNTGGRIGNVTSTYLQLTGAATNNDINAASATYVAYCFAAIPGYSAFGSYTGNGSTDGPFVYCGFRPRFILVKRSTTDGAAWNIVDSSRNTYNVANAALYPNLSNAESTTNTQYDLLSNGFKVRDGTSGDDNLNGGTYIYAAFAENPMKYALAR